MAANVPNTPNTPDVPNAPNTPNAPNVLDMEQQWLALRHRLCARGLMLSGEDSLSLRCPGEQTVLWGKRRDTKPLRLRLDAADASGAVGAPGMPSASDRADAADAADAAHDIALGTSSALAIHREIYTSRDDVCAVLAGGGPFGRQLGSFGGQMPAVFDEQIRQLGVMSPPTHTLAALRGALATGGNVAIHAGQVLLLGMTPSRLALNAELFEKCAKAYVCAVAAGGRVHPLPWLVRYIANGRLMKDEKRARVQVNAGRLPAETRGY